MSKLTDCNCVLIAFSSVHIKTHGSEACGQETTKRMPNKKMCHHCYELFTCRDGFSILALDYAISLIEFVLCSMIKKTF